MKLSLQNNLNEQIEGTLIHRALGPLLNLITITYRRSTNSSEMIWLELDCHRLHTKFCLPLPNRDLCQLEYLHFIPLYKDGHLFSVAKHGCSGLAVCENREGGGVIRLCLQYFLPPVHFTPN